MSNLATCTLLLNLSQEIPQWLYSLHSQPRCHKFASETRYRVTMELSYLQGFQTAIQNWPEAQGPPFINRALIKRVEISNIRESGHTKPHCHGSAKPWVSPSVCLFCRIRLTATKNCNNPLSSGSPEGM